MTWVKVCGVTDMRAVTAAVDGGVDAIGFNLVIGSPRYIDPERATALMRDLPVLRFVVTADLDPADAFGLLEVTGADGIQNHGIGASAVAAEAIDAGYLALRPIPVTGVGEVPIGDLPSAVMPLFDTAHPDMHGGTG
ncbi:MAG: hypothetical protein KDB69_08260, partial [Acidimicrobiia bacterium]|nr:hypothetical protein [Acidimicrobiia bacterium]